MANCLLHLEQVCVGVDGVIEVESSVVVVATILMLRVSKLWLNVEMKCWNWWVRC